MSSFLQSITCSCCLSLGHNIKNCNSIEIVNTNNRLIQMVKSYGDLAEQRREDLIELRQILHTIRPKLLCALCYKHGLITSLPREVRYEINALHTLIIDYYYTITCGFRSQLVENLPNHIYTTLSWNHTNARITHEPNTNELFINAKQIIINNYMDSIINLRRDSANNRIIQAENRAERQRVWVAEAERQRVLRAEEEARNRTRTLIINEIDNLLGRQTERYVEIYNNVTRPRRVVANNNEVNNEVNNILLNVSFLEIEQTVAHYYNNKMYRATHYFIICVRRSPIFIDRMSSSVLIGSIFLFCETFLESKKFSIDINYIAPTSCDTYECNICYEPRDFHTKVEYNCGHSFCVSCVVQHRKSTKVPDIFKCAYCRVNINLLKIGVGYSACDETKTKILSVFKPRV